MAPIPAVIDHSRLLVFKATVSTSMEGSSLMFCIGLTLKLPCQKKMSEATSAAKIDTGIKDIQRLSDGEISFLLSNSSGRKRGTNVAAAIPAISIIGCSNMLPSSSSPPVVQIIPSKRSYECRNHQSNIVLQNKSENNCRDN